MDKFTLRSHETADYKRCKKKWYWKWRRGLVLKAHKFGALDLGTWMHAALAAWYGPGLQRNETLLVQYEKAVEKSIQASRIGKLPEHDISRVEELIGLGECMATAYEATYGDDSDVEVIDAEIPLEFEITNSKGKHITNHKLKPDLVYRSRQTGAVWLMEHKTATQIQTEHLVIDGQARPYGVMAERALRRLGVISKAEPFKGIMYNFLRKMLPDERPTDDQGRALNKNGSVSARQPGRQFWRHPVTLTRAAKLRTLETLAMDAVEISAMTKWIRDGTLSPSSLPITPDRTCPRFCDFFPICVSSEQGSDPRTMEETMYLVRDPYLYDEETTDESN